MNYKKVFWGAILVLFGILLILKNTGVLNFSWWSVWHMWPVLLILWGISLLPFKDYLKLIISIAIVILSFIFLYQKGDDRGWIWHFGKDWDEEAPAKSSQNLSEPLDSTTRIAILNFDAAAGAFKVEDTTAKLIAFEKSGNVGTYSMETRNNGDSAIIQLKMHDTESGSDHRNGNRVMLKLNPKPEWEFNMDVGASSVDFNLSKYKIKKIELDGGACSVTLKLGNLQKMTNIDISSGASSIRILVPKEAGCEASSDSFLSSRHLEGLEKQDDGLYRTENYTAASQKVIIHLESAISSLNVERY